MKETREKEREDIEERDYAENRKIQLKKKSIFCSEGGRMRL